MMKKAVTTGESSPLDIVEGSIPAVPKHGVLIKTSFAGICHTDLGFIKNWTDLGAGKKQARADFLRNRGEKYEGVVLGHEISGRITAFGDDCDNGNLEVGDRVVVYPWIGCGGCDMCLGGYNNLCDENHGGTVDIGLGPNGGGYAEYVAVPHSKYVTRIPDTLPLDLACLLPCSGLTAYCAILKTRPHVQMALNTRRASRILVIGAGGLGLWGIKLARLMFAGQPVEIVVADIGQSKIDLACESGADESVLLGVKDNVEELVSKMTIKGSRKFDAVIDFVGADTTTQAGASSLHKAGTLVVVGLFGGQIVFPSPRLVFNTITIQGTRTGPQPVMEELITLLAASGTQFTYSPIEHHVITDINVIHEQLRQGKINGRAVIKFE